VALHQKLDQRATPMRCRHHKVHELATLGEGKLLLVDEQEVLAFGGPVAQGGIALHPQHAEGKTTDVRLAVGGGVHAAVAQPHPHFV
jgi:hypothetical protein